jgi:hypothetical protein
MIVSNKQPPTLEARIAATLNNPNAGSEALAELIEEVETAAFSSVETAEAERTRSLDLVQCPDPREARERIAAADLAGDRLKAAAVKLRDRLTQAVAIERRDRWLADYEKVREQRDELVEQCNAALDVYESAKAAVDAVVDRMLDCNLDIERVNHMGSELQDWSKELPPLETPSTWYGTKEQRRWGPPRISNGGLAVACAQSVPATYNPARWSDPDVRAQQRAEAEKRQREMGEFYQRQTEAQEERQNAEERERFASRP